MHWENETNDELIRGYEDMAADTEREAEASEWIEAFIEDGFDGDILNGTPVTLKVINAKVSQ